MPLENLDALMKKLRRKPIYSDDGDGKDVQMGRDIICTLLPHREPFLLVDTINGLDSTNRTIRGSRLTRDEDPVFAGHFPAQPIYPGVLQVEAMGQLAICLARLTDTNNAGRFPTDIRAIRIHHALFIEPIFPDDNLTIHAAIVEDNGITAISAGQIYKGSNLCSYSVQEVYVVE